MATGEEEFAALVHRQSRFAYRVAYAVLLNAADAEDAVQETFLKLYRHSGWQNAQNERAYIARVAWRVAVDGRRASRNDAPAPDNPPEATSSQPGPESMLLAADRQARVHALIDTLPEELRVPLIMSANEELNSREIGEALGVPEGTVRTRLQRARHLLRQKLSVEEVRRA